jgi:hypothetical protein
MIALLVILGIASVITWIWLIVAGFKESALWGIGIILLPFPIAIVFAAMHWQNAKKPFLAYIIVNILFTVIWFNMFSEMFLKTMEVAKQEQSGEITEEEAQRRMLEMFGMEVPADLQKKATGPTTTEDEISKLTEQLEKNNTPEPVAPPVPQRVEVFKSIKLSQANKHIGQILQVMTIDGVVKQGTLIAVRYDRLVLQREYRGGSFSFDVLNRTIKNVEVQEFVEN